MNTEQKAVDVLAVLRWASVSADAATESRECDEAYAALAELFKADDQLIEMCDELVRVNNKTLGRGAVRIQAAIIDRFLRKLERSRAALAHCKGE